MREAASTKRCTRCLAIKEVDDFPFKKRGEPARFCWCRSCISIRNKEARNRPGAREVASRYAARYYQENRERLDIANKEAAARTNYFQRYGKRWREENPDKVNAKAAYQRAAKRCATPAWANREKMLGFYKEAARLSETTGVPHDVDHIVPLIGPWVQSLERGDTLRKKTFVGPLIPLVCGLHCQENLQVITERKNAQKSNKHWPDMANL